MAKRSEHTQVGYLIIAAMAAAMVFIGTALANAGISWIAIAVLIIKGRNQIVFQSNIGSFCHILACVIRNVIRGFERTSLSQKFWIKRELMGEYYFAKTEKQNKKAD